MISALPLLLLFAIAYGAPTGDTDQYHVFFQGIQKTAMSLAPQGRSFSSGASPAAVQCVSKCARQMRQDMARELPGTSVDKPGPYSPEQLEKMCKIHDKTKSCMDPCGDSQVKTFVEKSLAILQHMCSPSYKPHAKCLYDVDKETKATCEGPSKCGPLKTKLDGLRQNKPKTEPEFKDFLTTSCQSMKCMLDCAKPTIVQKCTEAAFNELKIMTSKGIDLQKYIMDALGLGHIWPSECNSVTA